jgi:hypothetical protein
VRASSQYGQVQPRQPSKQFDSVAPTSQRRTPVGGVAPVGHPSGPRPTSENAQGSSPRPRASEPSLSFSPPARRSTGLIAVVLVIDLALAATGAMLLAKGLSAPAPASSTSAPAKK